MSGEYDALYTPTKKKGWIDKVSPEARAWLDGLAEHVRENGEPTWHTAWLVFCEKFPDDAPLSDTTLRVNVRNLV